MSEKSKFREIKVLREPDGVCAVLTECVDNGKISFALFKEYTIDAATKKSGFLSERHIPSLRKILNKVATEIEILHDHTHAERRQ